MQAEPSPRRTQDLLIESEPSLDEVLHVFGIRDHERRTYRVLRRRPQSTVAELAAELDRDRSNVNRSLSTLCEKGLADRERRLLDGGGHVYQYAATPPAEVRTLLHRSLEAWADAGHDRIDDFGE
ncbi:MAG: helix-turn-helix domain-containing protein [Haloarculaceae archaeon]